jgi:hypothetical protein
VSVSQQLSVPKLEALVLRHRPLKMGAISCQQKYLTLIFFACLQVGESTTANKMASGWRGYVRALKTSGASRDGAQNRLQTSAAIRMNIYSLLTHLHTSFSALCKAIHIYMQALPNCKTCLPAKIMPQNKAAKKCRSNITLYYCTALHCTALIRKLPWNPGHVDVLSAGHTQSLNVKKAIKSFENVVKF